MATIYMSLTLLVNLGIIFLTGCAGEFIVTHAPGHVQFMQDATNLKLGEIQDVITSAFGFEINKDYIWNGLGPGNLFQRPKANVMFSVEEAPKTALQVTSVARYGTEVDTPVVDTENVVNAIQSTADEKPLIVDFSVDSNVFEIRSHQPDLFKNVPATHEKLQQVFASGLTTFSSAQMGSLNATITADLYFLGEMHMVKEIMRALKENPQRTKGKSPDFFHFKIRGLQALSNEHGEKSRQMEDATTILRDFLEEMTEEFQTLYDGNVVIEVVTIPHQAEILSRKARHLLQDTPANPAPSPATSLNLAAAYDDMFPVTFNIIFWLMVVLTLSIIGISYGIWFMDPGRDSIIYRMTSQRIKKD